MSIVFQFRMLSDENDNFVRDYQVLHNMTLLEFHEFIVQTLEYEECVTSFYTADQQWERLREFTPIDMGDLGEDGPLAMENVSLGQILHKIHDRLIYLFDMFGERAYYLELVAVSAAVPSINYPIEIYAQEDAPDQYDPAKNPISGDGSIFNEVMGDFNEFEGSDSYEDD